MTTPTPIEAGARADLLPCPFCGGKSELSIGSTACVVVIECSNAECPVKPSVGYFERRLTEKAWNTRAGSPASAVADMRERCAARCDSQEYRQRNQGFDALANVARLCAESIRSLDLSPAGGDYVVVPRSILTDAQRYKWLRDGNAFAPEEQGISGGEELDQLCDGYIADRPSQRRHGRGGGEMKLSKSQIDALQKLADTGYSYGIPFRTGEALRRMGYVARYTEYILKAEYVEQESTTRQYTCTARKPYIRHEWNITKEGRAAIPSPNNGEG